MVPDGPGTEGKRNCPTASVRVSALSGPDCRVTNAPEIRAPLESRTVPWMEAVWAAWRGIARADSRIPIRIVLSFVTEFEVLTPEITVTSPYQTGEASPVIGITPT